MGVTRPTDTHTHMYMHTRRPTRTDLRPREASFHQLRTTKITEAHVVTPSQKDVFRFDVAVQNGLGVQRVQARRNLDRVGPDCVLFDVLVCFFKLLNLATYVAVLSKFHDDVEVVALDEGVAVAAPGKGRRTR